MGCGENLRHVEARASLTATNSAGMRTIHWLIRDITERRRAEAGRTDSRDGWSQPRRTSGGGSAEIHDQLGQELTGLTLGLKLLEADIPEGTPASRRLVELRETIDKIGREAHELCLSCGPRPWTTSVSKPPSIL